MPKPRTEEELWEALQRLDDPLDPTVPAATIDAELVAAGLDPKTLAEEGLQAAKGFAAEKRLAWQKAAQRKADIFTKRAPRTSDIGHLSHTELVARLNTLRTDPRLGAPIMTAFRKRKPEESSVDDLRTLLEDIETLRSMTDEDDEK